MNRISLTLLAAVAALAVSVAAPVPRRVAAYARQAAAAQSSDELDAEEYAVISAIVNDWDKERREARGGEPRRTILIRDTTEPWQGFEQDAEAFKLELKKSSNELLAETVDDYLAKNKEPHKLAARLDVKVGYRLVDSKEIEGFFKEKGPGGWGDFYKKYPKSGGFVTFSRVGFNGDRTQALVYQSHSCGGLCGGGSCLLLLKEGGSWVVKGGVGGSWVS